MIELIHTKSHLVFGCGNPLLGDDGFGLAVIEHLEETGGLPDHVGVLDVGTAIRDFLFDILLTESKPRQIIVVDAADKPDRPPGDLYEIPVTEIESQKSHDFSLHQFPTTNMLHELQTATDIEIRILVVQVAHIPDVVSPGLSPQVQAAVPAACGRIAAMLGAAVPIHTKHPTTVSDSAHL
ncbi:MAG: hydrogenase maturation protease [Desulfosarcinaceae bacterium]|nr:hydrogenase maturation protease [Desulfosarcinaceae bacterium]